MGGAQPSSGSRSYEVEGGRLWQAEASKAPSRRRPMSTDHLLQNGTAHYPDPDAIFVSLELSRSRWLVTSMSPGSEKMSKHSVTGGDAGALLDLLARLRARTQQRTGASAKLIIIHEAGFDGFWIHRLLTANGIESHVVEPA